MTRTELIEQLQARQRALCSDLIRVGSFDSAASVLASLQMLDQAKNQMAEEGVAEDAAPSP